MPNQAQIQAKLNHARSSLPSASLPASILIKDNLYYVNGMLKSKSNATKALNIVNSYFGALDFRMIYNGTEKEKDLREISKDYSWLIGTSLSLDFSSAVNPNSTMYEVLAILEIAKNNNYPLGLIGSSQGTLIIYNAVLAFSLLSVENKNYLKSSVKLCLVGNLVPRRFFGQGQALVKEFLACVSDRDALSTTFTDEGNISGIKGYGRHAIKWYLPTKQLIKWYYSLFTDLDSNEPFVPKSYFEVL